MNYRTCHSTNNGHCVLCGQAARHLLTGPQGTLRLCWPCADFLAEAAHPDSPGPQALEAPILDGESNPPWKERPPVRLAAVGR